MSTSGSVGGGSSKPGTESGKFQVHHISPSSGPKYGKKAAVDYKSMYDKLYRQFQKATIKCQEYRQETHDLRAVSETHQKQIAYAERKAKHLKTERDELREKFDSSQKMLNKIERKLAGGTGGQYLADRYKELRRHAKALKAKVQQQADIISSQEGNLYKASEEIEVLARALEVRSEELKLQNGGSVEDSLLYEVASLKQKINNMGDVITDKEEKMYSMKQEVESLKVKLIEQEDLKRKAEGAAIDLRRECDDSKEREGHALERADGLENERTIMLDYIKEMQEKLTELQSRSALDEKSYKSKIQTLNNALERLKQKDGGTSGKLLVAEQRVENMERVQTLTEQRLAEEHVKKNDLKDHVASQSQQIRAAATEAVSLKQNIMILEEEKGKQERTISHLRKQLDENNLMLEDMGAQTVKMRQSLETLQDAKNDEEVGFRGKIEGIVSELEKAVLDKERAESSMRVALDKYDQMEAERNEAIAKLKDAENASYLIKENKSLLQKTMMEQLSSLRLDVEKLTMERDTAAIELTNLKEEKSNLAILMDATRAKNNTAKAGTPHRSARSPGNEFEFASSNTLEHMEQVRSALKKYGTSSSRKSARKRSPKSSSPSLIDLASVDVNSSFSGYK